MGIIKGDQEVEGTLFAADIQFYIGKHGDIMYKDRGKWKKLHIGTTGQVLTVDANGFPSWQDSGGPQFSLIETGIYVGDGNDPQQILSIFPSNYSLKHAIIISRMPQSGAVDLIHRFEKNDRMLIDGIPASWTHGLLGEDKTLDSVTVQEGGEISLNDPGDGSMSVSALANTFGEVYFFTVWASPEHHGSAPHYRVTFHTDPTTGGSIDFGTYLNNHEGDSLSIVIGSYVIAATPPALYTFDHWEVTGGVSFIGNLATLTGAGTLKAVFAPI